MNRSYIVESAIHGAALLVLAGCQVPIHVGDNPLEESASSGGGSEDSGGEPTGGEDAPVVCGDGVVGAGEVCDDGNDEAEDGCDAACARTGNVQWSYTPTAPLGISDVAVDGDGRVILAGPGRVLALGPDGEELWEREVVDADAFMQVVVDSSRRIYLGSGVGVVYGLDPEGHELWREGEVLPAGGRGISGIAVTDDTFYSLVNEGTHTEEQRIVLRTHDRDTGEIASSVGSPPGTPALGYGLAVSGSRVVAVGFGSGDAEPPLTVQAMVAVFDLAGAPVSFDLGEVPGQHWDSVAATSDGGFVLTGAGPEPIILVRRLDAQLQLKWTRSEDAFFGTWALEIASGPGEALAIAGNGHLEVNAAFVRRYSGAGEPVWTSAFMSPQPPADDSADALAFGPDFLVALGHADAGPWVRRFAID